MNLTRHFTLEEMLHTQVRGVDNSPSESVMENLRLLCEDLEEVRRMFGPLRVSSGYRNPELNAIVGGSKNSAHMEGAAADIIPLRSDVDVTKIMAWLKTQSVLQFDQAIDEHGWLHYGIVPLEKSVHPRFQTLKLRKGKLRKC